MIAHTGAPAGIKGVIGRLSLSAAPRRGALSAVEIAVLTACLIAALAIANRHAVDIMIRTFLWAGLALAWNIAGGYAGLISFGHAAFFGIGAYTSTILLLSYGVPPWIGLLAGAMLAACAGALLTAVCARLRGPFFILSTLAAGEVTRIAALNWRSLTGGSEGLEIPPIANAVDMVFKGQWPYLALVLAYMLILFAVSATIERSRYGYYLFATRDDEDGAAAIGINPRLMRISAMALSAALTAVGGTLFAQYFLYLDPTHIISPEISFQFALICALGGLGDRQRAGVRRIDHRSTVGAPARLPLAIGVRPASGDLRNHRHHRHPLFPVRHFRRNRPCLVGAVARRGRGKRRKENHVMLRLDAVGRQFGALWAVRDVTFTVARGEIVGIIGPNGAGKSTLFNLIAGAVPPSRGDIRFLDHAIAAAKPYQVARLGLARTFQIPNPFRQLTVRENVMLSALRRHRTPHPADPVAVETMDFVGIGHLADASSASRTVGLLKKLEVARALATEPSLMLLDEVMAGLTPPEIKEMMAVVASLPERGITVLWVEHVMMAIMNVAQRLVVMHQGQVIAQGSPADISKNPAVIGAYLGETYAARS